MSKMVESEKVIERRLYDFVKNRKGLCIKLLTNHLLGLPDRICLLPYGRIFFVELKSTGVLPKKIQLYMHEKLRKLGFNVYIIDSTEGVNKLIEAYDKSIYVEKNES